MIIPVRCFGCGKPVGQLWEEYKKRTESGEEAGKVLDELGLERYCCRACLLGHADMLPQISKFKSRNFIEKVLKTRSFFKYAHQSQF